MPTIQITHNDEVRQFAVSPHSTWAEFSSTIRAMFSISPSTVIWLSYTDEDGDTVLLSSEVEFSEVFNQSVPESGPMKFKIAEKKNEHNEEEGVVIPNNRKSVDNSRQSSVCEKEWVLEGISGHEIVVNKDKLEDDMSSCDGEFEDIDEDKKSVDIESRSENGGLPQEHTEEERIPLLHGLSQAEVDPPSEEEKTDLPDTSIPDNIPETNIPETNIPDNIPETNIPETNIPDTNIPPASPPPSASNSNPTLDDLTQQLQSLVNQFQEFFVQNPQIMETANRLMHDVVESVRGDMETFGEWLQDMKRQIEENILQGMDINANRNRTRTSDTGETSQYAYTPTYTPSAQAYHENPFLSGMPGNILNSQRTNNEERSSDQAKDELPPPQPLFVPRSFNGHPPPSSSSHFTSDPSDYPNLPSSFTAPPPPPPPPPVPQHTTQEQQGMPYVHQIFKNLGTRLGMNNSGADEDTTDNMDYSPSHNYSPSHRFFAYQTPDGDIKCGRGPFGGRPRFGRSEYPGAYSGNATSDDGDIHKADETERTNSKHFERSDIDDQNVQDFALAPSDLLADIRHLREMGFTQPTRELVTMFRRNGNNIDEVLSILLEETENRY